MANAFYEFINAVTTTPQPELREACVALLDIELERAQNEVFGPGAAVAPDEEYTEVFQAAQRVRKHRWLSLEQLDLPLHWLMLLGYRFRAETGHFHGGLIAAHFRAADVLSLSPGETCQWDVDLLFQAYVNNARLREEWYYKGLHFRFENFED